MGWQPEPGGGTGTGPDRDPSAPARDPRREAFAGDGTAPGLVPSGTLALLVDELSGRERHYEGATDNEVSGMLRVWAAVESWAGSGKLSAVREMMRRDGAPTPGAGHGGLPEEWSASLRHELALGLASSVQAAESTAWLAWELQARLPGIGALLDDGTLTVPKARAVAEAFRYLSDAGAGKAEALVLARLAGKTHMQVVRLAEQAALTVDPDLAERRRAEAQKGARVSLFREEAGTAGLSGRDLPPDETLAAMGNVNARAGQYKNSGAFGDARMDLLRVQAYLDLLNEVPAEVRIAAAVPYDEAEDAAELLAWAESRAARNPAASASREDEPGDAASAEDRYGDSADDASADVPAEQAGNGESSCDPAACASAGPDGCACRPGNEDDEPDDSGDGGGPGGGNGSGGRAPRGGPAAPPEDPLARRRRPADLIVPLATLLGLAERPGEIQGFGLLDPALARDLAAAATTGPKPEVCVTVTSPEGYAIGHGCARPERRAGKTRGQPASQTGFPARLNLTIPAAELPGLARRGSPTNPWAFAPGGAGPPGTPSPRPEAGSPDGYGTWALVLPGGRRFTVRLEPVPTFGCDHRHGTHRYQPGDKLRHLVQVRDGTCTFPSCDRYARESDFEHARPYGKGGQTCVCNAGARSRACHRVKQSPGWNVTQPQPGWHRWETPAGRVYTQEPKRYTA